MPPTSTYSTCRCSSRSNDGDANHDADVDGGDLTVWQTQYGSETPLAANLQADSAADAAAGEQSVPAELIDTAMAFDWSSAKTQTAQPLVAPDAYTGEVSDTNFTLAPATTAIAPAETDAPQQSFFVGTTTEIDWLDEELLDLMIS